MTIERALELLPQMRDSEWITVVGQVTAIYTDEAKEVFNTAISALEKQEQSVDKCCETCKHKSRSSQEIPCCDCYMSSCFEDCYEPYTEDEA